MRDKLIEFFETNFDAIYCIFYTGNKERLQPLQKEFDRVGISDCKNFHWYYDVSSPYDQIMYKDIFIHNPYVERDKLNVKKLSINHYKIIKTSFELGYKKILIFEDDIRFLKDLDLFYKLLIASPADADIVLYDKLISHINFEFYKFLFKKYAYIEFSKLFAQTGILLSSCGFYSLSINGMKYIIECQEKALTAADTYTNNVNKDNNTLKRYVANINLGIQNQNEVFDGFYKPFVNFNLYNLENQTFKTSVH